MAVFPNFDSLDEKKKKAIARFIFPKPAVIPASQIETFKKYLAGELDMTTMSQHATYSPLKK